jgi:hypothetical protein
MDIKAEMPRLLPLAVTWAESQEARILREGDPLRGRAVTLARLVGVLTPDRVRVLLVPRIPRPEQPSLAAACEQLGFLEKDTVGLVIGYAMFIRRGFQGDPILMAHELRHVAQYEKHESVAAYISQYFQELLRHGYDRAPYEIDACSAATRAARQIEGHAAQE